MFHCSHIPKFPCRYSYFEAPAAVVVISLLRILSLLVSLTQSFSLPRMHLAGIPEQHYCMHFRQYYRFHCCVSCGLFFYNISAPIVAVIPKLLIVLTFSLLKNKNICYFVTTLYTRVICYLKNMMICISYNDSSTVRLGPFAPGIT